MDSYDGYYWRLFSEAPYEEYDVILPKDLEWSNEFSWDSVTHTVTYTLAGSVVVQEAKKTIGRPIGLIPLDDMAWLQRPKVKMVYEMSQNEGLIMTLEFTNGTDVDFSHNVIFDHTAGAFEVESAKRFDSFNDGSWFKVQQINFLEVNDESLYSCSS